MRLRLAPTVAACGLWLCLGTASALDDTPTQAPYSRTPSVSKATAAAPAVKAAPRRAERIRTVAARARPAKFTARFPPLADKGLAANRVRTLVNGEKPEF